MMRRRRTSGRHKATPPQVRVTPVYRVSPAGDEHVWKIVDELEPTRTPWIVRRDQIAMALSELAVTTGGPIDVGLEDNRWVRVHTDGTTDPAARPPSIDRYEQMRKRDCRDLALLAAVAQQRLNFKSRLRLATVRLRR